MGRITMTDKQVIKGFVEMMERDSRIYEKELQDCRQDMVSFHFGELEAYRGIMMTGSYKALKALVVKPVSANNAPSEPRKHFDYWDTEKKEPLKQTLLEYVYGDLNNKSEEFKYQARAYGSLIQLISEYLEQSK